ncbi:ACT domain-containing protein ACR8-like [Panicum miliaceum]|uniref:ACT domain-containing protein ACR n=1 Tax=Panicum miliaceum TaxID=4540 RepID=A0A3L6RHZ9_PANMI|nr:ACT domain-containing protein ACR8-like [Panicum miliaceum]
MEWLDEYEKLVIRMNTPRVVIDNAVCPTATLVQVDSARKRGVLLEAVQVLADLDLSINKAYISSDGRWFMDVFHVTDRLGRKLTDDSVITYIEQVGLPPSSALLRLLAPSGLSPARRKERPFRFSDGPRGAFSQSLGTWNGPARPAALEGLTALELTGADRTGLLSEVFAVLADMECSVVEARAWTHRGRLACVAFLRGEDADAGRVARILVRLGHLVRGGAAAPGAVAAVPAAGVAHADRRLHQLMAADRDPDRAFPTPAVSVDSWAERGYSVVTVQCRDRPKLLFDVVCTLHDMDYVVFHGTVDTTGDQARQEFYIRHADGSPIRSEAERERVCQCLQAAIERRSLEGVRLELCTPDRPGLLSDVTRTFRENGLLVAQAEVSTKGDLASNVFYVSDAAGNAVDQCAIDAVRERVGTDRLVVREEPRPQLCQKAAPGERYHGVGGGLGLVYLGNLVKRNLYNLGLIKSCS